MGGACFENLLWTWATPRPVGTPGQGESVGHTRKEKRLVVPRAASLETSCSSGKEGPFGKQVQGPPQPLIPSAGLITHLLQAGDRVHRSSVRPAERATPQRSGHQARLGCARFKPRLRIRLKGWAVFLLGEKVLFLGVKCGRDVESPHARCGDGKQTPRRSGQRYLQAGRDGSPDFTPMLGSPPRARSRPACPRCAGTPKSKQDKRKRGHGNLQASAFSPALPSPRDPRASGVP